MPASETRCCPFCPAEFEVEGYLTYGAPETYWWHLHEAHALGCDVVQGHLAAYLGGEVPDELDQRIILHLQHCEPCRKELTGSIILRRANA